MPGEAIVTIRDKQWLVGLAAAPQELLQGLGGLPYLPPGTGMLFDLGTEQTIAVTTAPLLFPLDILFISEALLVTEVARNIAPGYLVAAQLHARYFLEVNPGETAGIQPGDQVILQVYLPAGLPAAAPTDVLTPVVQLAAGVMVIGFTFGTMTAITRAVLARPEPKVELYGPRGERLLLKTRKGRPTRGDVRVPKGAQGAHAAPTDVRRKWYEKGVEAGMTDGWMDVESTVVETQERHQLKGPHELVWTDIEEWEATDHFRILYGSKMMEDADGDYDLYADLKSEFWEGYLEGRKETGIDIYKIASGLLKHHSNPGSGETIVIPFSAAPHWVREEWTSVHGRTRPRVRVYRTTVAQIPPPTFEYAVRDIVAHKAGRTMRAYVPSYESLLAATPEQRALYFGGAVKLASDETIAVMDYWGDRYQNIDLYVHPQAYQPPKVIGPVVTERQKKILATIRSYIPAYRREVLSAHEVTQKELDELRELGLIDKRGAITVMGRNVVGREEPWGMYSPGTEPKLIGPREQRELPEKLEFFADSHDHIDESMNHSRLRPQLEETFRKAIERARRAYGIYRELKEMS